MKPNSKKFKKALLLTPKNTATVTDYISELPLTKNFKIIIEEVQKVQSKKRRVA